MATRNGPRSKRRVLPFLLSLALCATAAASGEEKGGTATPLPVAGVTTDSRGLPNTVRLTGSAGGNEIDVEVVISGPTTSSDIYSFAFDLVIGDDALVGYVAGSAKLGSALSAEGSQQRHVLAVQHGRRVTIGATKLGAGPGNGVLGAEEVVVRLKFRLLRTGKTTIAIQGSPPGEPAALDSQGAGIRSVRFDSTPLEVSGS